MAPIGSLVDLLLFYTLERVLFNRMVASIGLNPQLVKKAIVLWLMLEEIGYRDLIRAINTFDNNTIKSLFHEALQCVECIQPNALEPTKSEDSPVFADLLDDPISRRFFYYNREFLLRRFVHIMGTVCDRIFGDTKAIEVDESGMRPSVRHIADYSSSQGAALKGVSNDQLFEKSGSKAPRQSALNPDAGDFYPGQKLEETRTMFLTFSHGHPLSREEIVNFFTRKWGEVVQDVFIEQPRAGEAPLYGRIVFTTSLVIPKVLNGQEKAKFLVNRKHLRARIYVSWNRG